MSGSMIGVKCQLKICRGHIKVSRVNLKMFAVDSSLIKLISKSDFLLLSSFLLQFEGVINGLGSQN